MRPHRPGRLLLAACLLASIPVLAPAVAAQDGGPASRSLSLAGRSPWVAADGVLRIDVATEGDVDPLLARVAIRTPVDTVEELDESLERDTGSTLYRMPELPVGFLPAQADGSRRLEIGISPTQQDDFTARLRRPGVYPVVVTFADETGEVISTIRTPVVRLGTDDEPLTAPDLAVLVELAAPPVVEVDGRRDLDDATLDRLADVAELISAGGQHPLPVTIDASPDTVDALTASTDPRAAEILDALASTAGNRTAVGAPYVPLDVPTLLAADLGEYVAPAVETGRAVLDDRLGPIVDERLWDSPDGVDVRAARLLSTLGVRHVLVDSPNSPTDASPAAERPLVDAGPVALPGVDGVDAVVVDGATSAALSAAASGRADSGHVALAELVLRDDGEESTVAIRATEVADDSVLRRLLALVADPAAPIDLRPVAPEAWRGPADDEDGSDDDLSAPELPEPSLEDVEDLARIAPQVRSVSDTISTFAGLVGTESARAGELRLQLLTSLAAGIDPDRRRELVDSVTETVASTFDAVSITGQTDLNLTSRRGTLPLMVANTNPFPVDVVLRISSDRLEFPAAERSRSCRDQSARAARCYAVSVAPEEIARLDVSVTARATGSVPTFVELLTPDEQVVLDRRDLDVRSTAVSGVGLAISLGALAVLVIWWARTWRRNRNGRSADRVGPGSSGATPETS